MPGSSKDLYGLKILEGCVWKKIEEEKRLQHVFHIYHTVIVKVTDGLYNCIPRVFVVLRNTNTWYNHPRLFCWINRSGHFCHSKIYAPHVSLIKTERFGLYVLIFWLKAFEKTLYWLISAEEMPDTKLYLGSESISKRQARHSTAWNPS